MNLYLADGEDMVIRAGPYQTIIFLAEDGAAAREVIKRESMGFRIDRIEIVRGYPQLVTKPAIVARITNIENDGIAYVLGRDCDAQGKQPGTRVANAGSAGRRKTPPP